MTGWNGSVKAVLIELRVASRCESYRRYAVMNNARLAVRIFGANVRTARMARGMSRRQLAEMTGMETGDIMRIERGRSDVSLMDALRLCESLKASIKSMIPSY